MTKYLIFILVILNTFDSCERKKLTVEEEEGLELEYIDKKSFINGSTFKKLNRVLSIMPDELEKSEQIFAYEHSPNGGSNDAYLTFLIFIKKQRIIKYGYRGSELILKHHKVFDKSVEFKIRNTLNGITSQYVSREIICNGGIDGGFMYLNKELEPIWGYKFTCIEPIFWSPQNQQEKLIIDFIKLLFEDDYG